MLSILTIFTKEFSDYFPEFLKSLNQQSFDEEFELIILDNGGDVFRDPLDRSLVPHSCRFRYCRSERLSRSRARNLLFREASGDVVLFLDPHVLLTGGRFLEDGLRTFRVDQLDALQATVVVSYSGSSFILRRYIGYFYFLTGKTFNSLSPDCSLPYLDTAALFVRKSSLSKVGGFDEVYDRAEDRSLGLEFLSRGFKVMGSTSLSVTKDLSRKSPLSCLWNEMIDAHYTLRLYGARFGFRLKSSLFFANSSPAFPYVKRHGLILNVLLFLPVYFLDLGMMILKTCLYIFSLPRGFMSSSRVRKGELALFWIFDASVWMLSFYPRRKLKEFSREDAHIFWRCD